MVAVNSERFTTHVTSRLLPLALCFNLFTLAPAKVLFCEELQHCARAGESQRHTSADTCAKTQKPKHKPFSHLTMKPLLLPYKRGSLMPLQYLLLHLLPPNEKNKVQHKRLAVSLSLGKDIFSR